MAKSKPNPPSDYPESGELIPSAIEVPPILEPLIRGERQYWTSLPCESHEDRARLHKVAMTQDSKIEDVESGDWLTEHLFASDVGIADEETGEIKICKRLVLIGPTGQTCSCVSKGAVDSLRSIVAFFGRPPWKPPLLLHFEATKTRKGFRTYVVTVK